VTNNAKLSALSDDALDFHHRFKTERCIKRYVQPTTASAPSTLWQRAIPQMNLIGAKRIRRLREGVEMLSEITGGPV
jgi:hypothetical protein